MDDDGETLFGMTWPAVVFGAACAWQEGEVKQADVLGRYDWAFHRHGTPAMRDAELLARAHARLDEVGVGRATDDAFWMDPFSEEGRRYAEKAQPVVADLRLDAERALAALSARAAARHNADVIEETIFAARRLDWFGMKLQFGCEMTRAYREAYAHLGDSLRVLRGLGDCSGFTGHGLLEDLRDGLTALRAAYKRLWLKGNRSYWLRNVLVRYDVMTQALQKKIFEIKAARRQYQNERTIPPPEAMGF